MLINKLAINRENFFAPTLFYDSARAAFGDILDYFYHEQNIKIIFMPAYIGISPKEGSGLYDPIKDREYIKPIFYKMNNDLTINQKDLFEKISNNNSKFLLLFVNYFGFIDSQIESIYKFVKEHNGYFIEDNAHAFFTYLNQKYNFSDVSFFSLHKQFPFEKGGMLKIHDKKIDSIKFNGSIYPKKEYNFLNYSFKGIQNIMIKNFHMLNEKLSSKSAYVEILRPNLAEGTVPQSFPILLKNGDRFKIYEILNSKGYGVTSLYHTLIEPLRKDEFYESLKVSSKILNLPVHQDVNEDSINKMVNDFVRLF